MNKENMQKWITALRSGEYEQGRSALAERLNGEVYYCCLGVLCEISDTFEDSGEGLPGLGALEYLGLRYSDRRVSKVFGRTWNILITDTLLDKHKVRKREYLDEATIASINDDGVSFMQIADILEEMFLKEELADA